jgi:hypothetical protein
MLINLVKTVLLVFLFIQPFTNLKAQSDVNCSASIITTANMYRVSSILQTSTLGFDTLHLNINIAKYLSANEAYRIEERGVVDNATSGNLYLVYDNNQYIQPLYVSRIYAQSYPKKFVIAYAGNLGLWHIKSYYTFALITAIVIPILGYIVSASSKKMRWLTILLTLIVIPIYYYLGLIWSIAGFLISILACSILTQNFHNFSQKQKGIKLFQLKNFNSPFVALLLTMFLIPVLCIIPIEIYHVFNGMFLEDIVLSKTLPSTVSISPDNDLVAIASLYPSDSGIYDASGDYYIEIVDTTSGELLTTLHGHRSRITNIFWTENRAFLVSTDREDNITIWGDLPEGCSILR